MGVALDYLKQRKKFEIACAYEEVSKYPIKTSIVGRAVRQGSFHDEENMEIKLPCDMSTRDSLQLLLELEGSMTIGEGVEEDTVVIRDADNRYVVITRDDLHKLLLELKQAALDLVHKKWRLQEYIDNSDDEQDVSKITWASGYSDIDTKGE